jgi:polyvinyl alcohol dehydrogenase (cytochrome)
MRYMCLIISILPAILAAQDGAAIYKERCASCHDAAEGRAPKMDALKGMTGEAIYAALTTGSMKSQAQGLSTPDIFALLGFIAPTGSAQPAPGSERSCQGAAMFHPAPDGPAWNGWSTSLTNSRFQDAKAAGLTVSDVPNLKLKWALNLGNVVMTRGQPAVVGGRLFASSQTGVVYALDAKTGCTQWSFRADQALRGGSRIADTNGVPTLYFADGAATIYALNAESGKVIWKVHPLNFVGAMATGTLQVYKGVVYQPVSSLEEALAANPKYECCKFRGSVIALNAATGEKLWQTFTIPEESKPTHKNASGTQQYGPSGAAIWSTPTIDEKLGALYVATGDNYSDPPTETSDAIVAMDLNTGKLLWSRQLTTGDAFNLGCSPAPPGNCPAIAGPDFDFGQPPILVELRGNRRELVIAQKSGVVHAIDPDRTGTILWQTRAGEGSVLGGSQWGSAADARNIYVAISDVGLGGVADPKSAAGFRITINPKKGGGLHAIDLKTGKIAWSTKPAVCPESQPICSPAQSAAVTAIPGAVFSGALDGHLRAYATKDGRLLWDFDTAREFPTVNGKPAHGGSLDATGAAVVGGMVFVDSGYNQYGGMPGNMLLAFSVDGK